MGNYVTVDDLRKEGLPSTVTDERANARIAKWEALVEQMTRNVFRTLSPGPLTFDGNNSRILHFNLPLISVSSLKINGETTALSTDEFRAYTGRQLPQDDRKNPKIMLTPQVRTIYRLVPGIFVKGLDQVIDATWGYLEPDDSTPAPIKAAIIQLVMLDSEDYFDSSGTAPSLASIRREKTDGHEIEYQQVTKVGTLWSNVPNHIAEVLAAYRAPIVIDAPEPIRYYRDPGIEEIAIVSF